MRHNTTSQKLQNEIKLIKTRLGKQEKTLSELRNIMTEIKDNMLTTQNSINSSLIRDTSPASNSMLSVYDRNANPWTIQTSKTLSSTLNSITSQMQKNAEAKRSFSTYEKTLRALATSPNGLTAEQVGKKTKRNRNTESAYLWRLHVADLIAREKHGKKTIYKLIKQNTKNILKK
ncbi:hypothetical protein [Nitrosopumilus sp.]|uniref:hypothetical protein n=1 Tax=Nitrosopumilus sp. TaxID=2024843 RepID=UPI00247BE7DF|nr:hypothetical protein [Nitrosopumilus sp.]MCV0430704.1 hypothetical protein [Nitrosopumilus sp.]